MNINVEFFLSEDEAVSIILFLHQEKKRFLPRTVKEMQDFLKMYFYDYGRYTHHPICWRDFGSELTKEEEEFCE